METTNFSSETLAFNKNALKMSFDALSAFSGQAAVAADAVLAANPSVPEEGKKIVSTYFKENQKGLDNLKKQIEGGLELDWTAKDAPVKSLEAAESFYKNAFSQAAVINKETNKLVEKATAQLPKEAKNLVDFWSESFNNSFEMFQNYVNKNFEYAKKVTTDAFVVAPAFASKASK